MESRILYLGLVLSMAGSPILADNTIRSGTDFWETQNNGSTYVDLNLPAGFFCANSAPFSGRVTLAGSPIATSPAGVLGRTDTVIERLGDATFDANNVATVNAIVRAASFKGTASITITGCSGSALWDVRSSAAPTQAPFPVTIRRSGPTATGGSFDSSVSIAPRLTFIQQGAGLTRTLDQATIVFSTAGAEWTHVPGSGGVTSSSSVQIDADGDGVPETTVPRTSNFAPGWSPFTKPGCTAAPCPVPIPHQAPSHSHWVIPPSPNCPATANCGNSSSVSCASGITGSCQAVDRNCLIGQRGYVTCNGVTTYCSACLCTEGATRNLPTGSCCDEGGGEKEQQVCSNGLWVYTGNYICSGPCGP
jgi:hypothetical protein